MNGHARYGNILVSDLRTKINPQRLQCLFSKLVTHKAHINTYLLPLQNTQNQHKLPIVKGSDTEAMYLKCIELFIADHQEIKTVRVQPMRFYGVPNEKVSITWELPLDGVLCVARENLYGGVFSNRDLRRELVPVELITIAKKDKNSISDIEIINGHDDAFLDLILFSVQP
jgi:hypothetical protein